MAHYRVTGDRFRSDPRGQQRIGDPSRARTKRTRRSAVDVPMRRTPSCPASITPSRSRTGRRPPDRSAVSPERGSYRSRGDAVITRKRSGFHPIADGCSSNGRAITREDELSPERIEQSIDRSRSCSVRVLERWSGTRPWDLPSVRSFTADRKYRSIGVMPVSSRPGAGSSGRRPRNPSTRRVGDSG